MKSSFASALLAITAAVSAAPAPAGTSEPYFSALALSTKDESQIYFLPIVARDQGLWVNGKTASYCPEQSGVDCPAGDSTSLAYGGNALSMGAVVPGGQQVYIAPDGRVSYTVAHSAEMPDGSITSGWQMLDKSGDNWDVLSHEKGVVACPTKNSETSDIFQVYVKVSGFNKKNCIPVKVYADGLKDATAWQYM